MTHAIAVQKILVNVVLNKMTFNFNHPKDVGMGYWKHLRFAWGEMVRLGCMEFVMFTHGLFPFIWDHKFSNYIKNAQERINGVSETTPKAWGDSSNAINMD